MTTTTPPPTTPPTRTTTAPAMQSSPTLQRTAASVITFDNVSKRFSLRHDEQVSLRQRLAHIFLRRQREKSEIFWALRDINFTMHRGETIGLIGHNGSGKSTTLKLVTRILEPTSGTVNVNGRISALLELGSGFHNDLTGRENIYLNGSLLGQSYADMRRKMDEIIEFSEIPEFIDTPVKHYSSGMYMRLAFAIAVSVDPDILITDEVLAVGDDAFQRKCLDRIYRFKRQGKTILFVSHALNVVQNLCDRVLWFDHGALRDDGDPVEVVDAYLKEANEIHRQRMKEERRRQRQQEAAADEDDSDSEEAAEDEEDEEDDTRRWGSREVEITHVEMLDANGAARDIFTTGETLIIRMHYHAYKPIDLPVFGIGIHHQSGLHINGPNTRFSDYPIAYIEGGGVVEYRIDNLPLLEGTYEYSAAVYDYTMTHPYDHHERKYTFKVEAASARERYGVIYMPSSWNWQPVHEPGA
jgi:ABC-type polysaccharide/polyol phosphate transport system ATPase subunit